MEFRVDRRPEWMSGLLDIRVVFPSGRPGDMASANGQTALRPAYLAPAEIVAVTGDAIVQVVPPMLTLRPEQAQQLCDALWDAGLRPSAGAGSVGQLGATERHLADMREVAFHALAMPMGKDDVCR